MPCSDNDKLKIAFSDNDKNLSIDNYRSIIIADNAHHCPYTNHPKITIQR